MLAPVTAAQRSLPRWSAGAVKQESVSLQLGHNFRGFLLAGSGSLLAREVLFDFICIIPPYFVRHAFAKLPSLDSPQLMRAYLVLVYPTDSALVHHDLTGRTSPIRLSPAPVSLNHHGFPADSVIMRNYLDICRPQRRSTCHSSSNYQWRLHNSIASCINYTDCFIYSNKLGFT